MRRSVAVVVLVGGLGNQLFQYAFALAECGEVVLDDRSRAVWGDPLKNVLRRGSWRRPTQLELLRAWQCPRLPVKQQFVSNKWASVIGDRGDRFLVQESELNSGGALAARGKVVVYGGYFQDERYVDSVKTAFLATLRPELLQPHPSFSAPGNHVAISMRLGADYQHFGVALSREYYRRAILAVMQGVSRPIVHVCADEPTEAWKVIAGLTESGTVVDHTHEGPVQQLRVLASASRVAVSNSSFAWWGAWLGDVLAHSPTREVFCPDRWLAAEDSVAPARWHRVRVHE